MAIEGKTLVEWSLNLISKERIDTIFNWCVKLLEVYASQLGMTYNELNVWIFCIIEPIIIVFLFLSSIFLPLFAYKRGRNKAFTNSKTQQGEHSKTARQTQDHPVPREDEG